MQVVLSIHHGKMSSSKLLRKLGNYSQKKIVCIKQAFPRAGLRNELYSYWIIFLMLNCVKPLRRKRIKVEAYNGLRTGVFVWQRYFSGKCDIDVEMEKAVKYNGILTNSVYCKTLYGHDRYYC